MEQKNHQENGVHIKYNPEQKPTEEKGMQLALISLLVAGSSLIYPVLALAIIGFILAITTLRMSKNINYKEKMKENIVLYSASIAAVLAIFGFIKAEIFHPTVSGFIKFLFK